MCAERGFIGMIIGEQLNADGTLRLKAQPPVQGGIDTGQCLAHSSVIKEVKWPATKTLLRDFIFWCNAYNHFNKSV
jgi:hypothetical protein